MVKLFELKSLTSSMAKSKKDIEQFYVTYANVQFDVIYDISKSPFELLIGAVGLNWACVLQINRGFTTQMSDTDFYELCKILNLKPGKETFTSYKFLGFVANKAPKYCSKATVHPEHFIKFIKRNKRTVSESDKIYFKGWNNHIKDGRIAHNFDKTEQFFGKNIAEYCRNNNISSVWTDIKPNNILIKKPWDK